MDFTINGKPLSALRVVDLKVELEKRGLPKSGNKNDLIERLSQYFVKQSQSRNEDRGVAHQAATKEEMSAGVQPPNVSLSHGLTDNDFVRDYLKLRETQFASALSEQDAHLHGRRAQQSSVQQQPVTGRHDGTNVENLSAQSTEHQQMVREDNNSLMYLSMDAGKQNIPHSEVTPEEHHAGHLKTAANAIKTDDIDRVHLEYRNVSGSSFYLRFKRLQLVLN